MSKFEKAEYKIGDSIILVEGNPFDFTLLKPYAIIATHRSKIENQTSIGTNLSMRKEMPLKPGNVIVLDNDGNRRFINMNNSIFGTWELLGVKK